MECDIYRKHTLTFTVHEAVEIRHSSKKNSRWQTTCFIFRAFFMSYLLRCSLHQTHLRLYIYFNIHVNARIIYTLKNWSYTCNHKLVLHCKHESIYSQYCISGNLRDDLILTFLWSLLHHKISNTQNIYPVLFAIGKFLSDKKWLKQIKKLHLFPYFLWHAK